MGFVCLFVYEWTYLSTFVNREGGEGEKIEIWKGGNAGHSVSSWQAWGALSPSEIRAKGDAGNGAADSDVAGDGTDFTSFPLLRGSSTDSC